jgi:hypothetical protein
MSELKNTTLDDIASVIGFSATVRLAAHYGGRDIYVPVEVSELHPIAKLLGVARLTHLSREWPGHRLSVPALGFADGEVRNAKVLSLLLHGMAVSHIANIVGLTDRRVHQLRREYESEGLLTVELPQENASENPPGKSGGKLLAEIW